MTDLAALGIDIEEIKEDIIVNTSATIAQSIGRDIKGIVLQKVSGEIEKRINCLVEEALNEKYQPIDDWGEPVGEETSLRDRFKKSCTDWWSVSVDSEGQPTKNSWKGKPRHVWAAENVMSSVLSGHLKKEFDQIVLQTKGQLREGIAKAITDAVDKGWK